VSVTPDFVIEPVISPVASGKAVSALPLPGSRR